MGVAKATPINESKQIIQNQPQPCIRKGDLYNVRK